MARSIKGQWRGKTDDSKAPPTVRQRVFDAHGGKCHLCGQPIKVPAESWELDHVTALVNGGENAESNLAPAHKVCHLAKTAKDCAEKSKVAAVRMKHTGAKRPKQSIRSKGFERKDRIPKPSLAPRSLYERAE